MDEDYKYALKCIFSAHTADVRTVKGTLIPEGGILTGSRDATVKVWAPLEKSYVQCHTFEGSKKFISSLCVLPPSAQYPKGLFLAGSNDCSIYGFTPDSSEPVMKLLGHSATVCSLSYGRSGFIVSGSWDKTARVWSGQQCVLTLQGHLEAVWATEVFPTQNLILTGSADHTIRMWRSGVSEKVFTGHEDCVRGLAIMSDMRFLSCSNDNTVRLWLTSGECLEVFKSHTDYIYSISLLCNGVDFVTCGEDQYIKIWKKGVCAQTIVVSPKSLWSVDCLSNGDLAVGTSEGKVYIFGKVPADYFEKCSQQSEIPPDSLCINGSDGFSSELFAASRGFHCSPVLSEGAIADESGVYNGETVVFYEDQSSSMYVCQYNVGTGTVIKKETLDLKFIEDTFYKKPESADTDSQFSSEKKDYVFDVDVENTIYKLAFDKGENPWEVASKFVAEHNLQNDHVGQIVDYILKNTVPVFSNEFFPVRKYLFYLNVNVAGLRAKLLEFCDKVPKDKQLSPSEVDELVLLANFPEVISKEQMSSLDKAISWSDDLLFPVLDLLRLGVRCKGLAEKISSKGFINHLLHVFMNTSKSVNRVLVEKILCNMFGIDAAVNALTFYQSKIFENVREKFSTGEENIQKAGSALFLNFCIASHDGFDLDIDSYCFNLVSILTYLVDSDAILRMLLSVGTVCSRNSSAVTYFRSANVKEFIRKFKACSENPKIGRVIELLSSDL